MKHDNTRALYAYWNDLRAGRSAPYRREVDPRAIEPLLDSTFILEHIDERTSRFRLAGTRLCENFGMELRGMSALALWHGDCREKVRDVLNHVVSDPCIGHVSCTVETRAGFLFDAEFLFLPLRSDFGDVSRILGCGYYMRHYGDLAEPHEPIHHWVDDARLLVIEAFAEDTAPPISPQKPALQETISVLQDQMRDALARPMNLTAIEGGRRGGLPIGVDRVATAERPRDHLRIVK